MEDRLNLYCLLKVLTGLCRRSMVWLRFGELRTPLVIGKLFILIHYIHRQTTAPTSPSLSTFQQLTHTQSLITRTKNPQILGLNPQSQIRQISEVCETANFKSANFFWLICKSVSGDILFNEGFISPGSEVYYRKTILFCTSIPAWSKFPLSRCHQIFWGFSSQFRK